MAGATEAIASFISRTSLADLPREAPAQAAKAIADTFAVILAGSGSEVAEPLLRYAGAGHERGPIPILGTGLAASPETAALVNATFGHGLDYDDVLSMMPAHPSVVIVAAALASLNGLRVSGRSFVEAYVLGLEVGGKIGLGMTQGHYQRGFHATGTLALFSAAAALAKLHHLDVPTTQQMFGIAASTSSGLRRNFGTMTKPLHSGLAARSALTALRLAQSGFTAAPDIMEAPSGFYSTYGVEESDPEITVKSLGRPFLIVEPGLALKKFPCCYATHRAMDGLLALRGKLGFGADAVEKITCRMPPGGMRVLTYPRPTTGLEGKFSLPYTLAAGALDGQYGLETFSDTAVRRSEIGRLYERIDAAEHPSCRGADPKFDKLSSGSRGFVEVEVKLTDGRSEHVRVDKAPGAPGRDLTWDELRAKFTDCTRQSSRISEGAAGQAFEMIRKLEQVDDVGKIVDLLH
jgi:2-methylcitrate dehydratase PrpD